MLNIKIFDINPDRILVEGIYNSLNKSEKYDKVEKEEIGKIFNNKKHKGSIFLILCTDSTINFIINTLINLRKQNPEVPVLLIAQHTITIRHIKQLLKLERISIVSSNITEIELHIYIDNLDKGNGKWLLSNDIKEILMEQMINQSSKLKVNARLTDKEEKIIELFKRGYSIEQTAGELKLSKGTIASHRSRILRKTGSKSMVQLLAKHIKEH